MNILLPGQYPRSEPLIAATRSFDRNRLSADELKKFRHDDAVALQGVQKGLLYASPGLFGAHDLLRPFTEIVNGLKIGTLKRYFETNSFWRVLESQGELSLNEDKADEWITQYYLAEGLHPAGAKLVFTLPFVFLFQEYSQGVSLGDTIKILEFIASRLAALPNKVICFSEPAIGWRKIEPGEKQAAIELLERLKRKTKTPVYITTSFFPLGADKDLLYALPADGYGIDFYANSIKNALSGFPKDKMLLAGIINTESTLIEFREKVGAFIDSVSTLVPSERIYLTPSGNQELLPRTVMDKKVQNLKEILS